MNFADRKQSVILSIFLFNSYSLTFLIPYAYSVLFSIQFFTTFFLCFTAQNNLRIVIYLTLICMFTFWLYMSFFNIVIKSTFSIVKITCIKLHIRLHFFLFVQSNIFYLFRFIITYVIILSSVYITIYPLWFLHLAAKHKHLVWYIIYFISH